VKTKAMIGPQSQVGREFEKQREKDKQHEFRLKDYREITRDGDILMKSGEFPFQDSSSRSA
jgi:hypothetical protein